LSVRDVIATTSKPEKSTGTLSPSLSSIKVTSKSSPTRVATMIRFKGMLTVPESTIMLVLLIG